MSTNYLKITHTSKKTGVETVIFDNTANNLVNNVGTLTTGVPMTESMDDGMNTAVLNLKECNGANAVPELFEPYDIIKTTEKTGDSTTTKIYLVGIDHRQVDNPYQKTYEKTVSLVEPTKYLDTIWIYNCNLTAKSKQLTTQVKRLLKNAEIILDDESQRVSMTVELESLLNNFGSEDFFFDNITLREALYRMFEVAHIVPYVTDITFYEGDISTIKLHYKTKNEFTNITSLSGHGEFIGDEAETSIDNYFGTLKARGYNSVAKNVQKTGIRPFTTLEATLTDENVLADLGLPIEDIRKFQVGGSFELQITYYDSVASTTVDGFIYIGNPGTNVTFYNGSFFWDISKNVIDNELYESLSPDEKNEHMPYTRGSTVIGMSKTYKTLLFTKSTIKTVINKNNNIPGYINGSLQNFKGSQIYKFLKTNNVPDSHGRTDYLNDNNTWSNVVIISPIMGLFFQAEFIPRIDTVIEISKPGVYDNDRLKIGIPDGQNANSIDIVRHGRSLGSLARRTGNAEIQLDFHCDDFSQLMPVMGKFSGLTGRDSYLNGYVITKREYGIYDNQIKVRYYCTKDYQAINERIGVNREKRLYAIPLEATDCPIHLKYYVTVGRTSRDCGDFPVKFVRSLIQGVLYTNRNEDSRVSYMYFRTNEALSAHGDVPAQLSGEQYFAMPCMAYAADKTVVFMAQPLDNYSVGYTRGGRFLQWWGGGMEIFYNPYTDANGECSNFTLILASKQAVDASINTYPKVTKGNETTLSQTMFINYVKDRTQRPVFFVDLEFLPAEEEYGTIVFGEAIANQNSFVISETQPIRYVYVGTRKYITGDTKIVGRKLTGEAREFFQLTSNNTTVSLICIKEIHCNKANNECAIAIGDENGNLIMGFNLTDIEANDNFYFNISRKL